MGRSTFVSVRRLRSGRYQARVSRPGHAVPLGSFATRRAATAAIAQAGTPAVPTPPTSSLGLEAWVEQWWQTRVGHRASTRERDRGILDHDIMPVFGEQPLADITATEVKPWVNELAARLAPSTVQRSYIILDQLLAAAVDVGVIAASPAARVRRPKPRRYQARFLNPAELETLAEAIGPRWRTAVLLMAFATLRVGEAAGLRRADVDLDRGTPQVANNLVEVGRGLVEGPPKTRAGARTMSLPAPVMAEPKVHLERSTASRRPCPRTGADRVWDPIRPAVE